MTAADTTSRLIASAVTADGYGDREVIVSPQTVEADYIDTHDEVLARAVLTDADETVPVEDDADDVLGALGYRRTGVWETTDFGAVAVVEAL